MAEIAQKLTPKEIQFTYEDNLLLPDDGKRYKMTKSQILNPQIPIIWVNSSQFVANRPTHRRRIIFRLMVFSPTFNSTTYTPLATRLAPRSPLPSHVTL